MKSKNRPLIAAIGLTLFLCIGGTTAYYTHWQQFQNQITLGENTIHITEEFEPLKEMELGKNTYPNRISITNSGTVPCYIRVFVAFSDSSVRDTSRFSHDKHGDTFFPCADYSENLPEDWTYIDPEADELLGGYYYYTSPVEAGDETTALVERVETTFEEAADIVDYEIIVYGESVQTRDRFGVEVTGSNAYEQAWEDFLARKES